ncbi:hypothetical protein ANN_07548 [Periplaneta americana]|uniref:Transmembrane protein family 132 fourth domain-containing protein n=1 Tax=Periplaneta americana TaxID=6978 RepID=A0ABQ8SZ27_PERAM|nr:hypothetical protein ANN_07548 [Periplaneta americana]
MFDGMELIEHGYAVNVYHGCGGMLKNWDVINTAVLTGRQVSQAMKVFIVSQAGKVADVTLQSSCHSEDESVLKPSGNRTEIFSHSIVTEDKQTQCFSLQKNSSHLSNIDASDDPYCTIEGFTLTLQLSARILLMFDGADQSTKDKRESRSPMNVMQYPEDASTPISALHCHNPDDLRNYAVRLTGFLEFGKDAATLPPRGFDGHLSILLNESCDWLLTGGDKISVTVRKTFIYDNLLVVGSRSTNGNIKIGDFSFEEVEKFKYFGATATNINDTREEIKRRINIGNACYYSFEKLLSSSLLSKNLKVRIYKTVISPVVLYGCETWPLNLREEQRLRVFEYKVLRKISGAKRDEVTGEWRKLHNAELHALYSSSDIIRNIISRRLRWAGHVARMGESRNAYRMLVGRPEGKRPLGRPRRRWKDNIKMDLREVGYDDREWINLAQDRD